MVGRTGRGKARAEKNKLKTGQKRKSQTGWRKQHKWKMDVSRGKLHIERLVPRIRLRRE